MFPSCEKFAQCGEFDSRGPGIDHPGWPPEQKLHANDPHRPSFLCIEGPGTRGLSPHSPNGPKTALHEARAGAAWSLNAFDLRPWHPAQQTAPEQPGRIRSGHVGKAGTWGFPKLRVRYGRPYNSGILLFGGLFSGSLIYFRKPPLECGPYTYEHTHTHTHICIYNCA